MSAGTGTVELRKRLVNLYAALSTASKSYDADAVAEAIEALSRPQPTPAGEIVERLRRSANTATLARQHRAGFYELPELVVSGFVAELREAAALIQQQQATIERLSAAPLSGRTSSHD